MPSVLCERRILQYFGHVIKKEIGNLEKNILFGKVS